MTNERTAHTPTLPHMTQHPERPGVLIFDDDLMTGMLVGIRAKEVMVACNAYDANQVEIAALKEAVIRQQQALFALEKERFSAVVRAEVAGTICATRTAALKACVGALERIRADFKGDLSGKRPDYCDDLGPFETESDKVFNFGLDAASFDHAKVAETVLAQARAELDEPSP